MPEAKTVPAVETQTTSELLRMYSGKIGAGGVMYKPSVPDEGGVGDEAKRELERRLGVIFAGYSYIKSFVITFGDVMRHAIANIFTVDVSFNRETSFEESFLYEQLGRIPCVNNVARLTERGTYQIAFDTNKVESRLVEGGEPAGIYVDEAPLTFGQITKPRLHWANLQFDKAVQPNIGGVSTAFKSITEVDGRLSINVGTFNADGESALADYVGANQPLGFSLDRAERPTHGLYLSISFEDFKALLPSSVVDDGRAVESQRVEEVMA